MIAFSSTDLRESFEYWIIWNYRLERPYQSKIKSLFDRAWIVFFHFKVQNLLFLKCITEIPFKGIFFLSHYHMAFYFIFYCVDCLFTFTVLFFIIINCVTSTVSEFFVPSYHLSCTTIIFLAVLCFIHDRAFCLYYYFLFSLCSRYFQRFSVYF